MGQKDQTVQADVVPSFQRIERLVMSVGTKFIHSWRTWATQARKGLVDIVDLDSIKPEVTHTAKHRQDQPLLPSKPMRETTAPAVSVPRHGTAVGLIEHSSGPSQHLMEVSVLESLGFYDPNSSIAVTVSSVERTYAPPDMMLTAGAAISSIGAKPVSPRSLLPDAELPAWTPHVIARSKLGRGRISYATIAVVSIVIVVVAALVAGQLRAPARQAAEEGKQVADHIQQLSSALTGLDPILADATTDIAQATPLLIEVDSSARALFEGASQLGDNPEQAVLRQSAASVAQRALDLESLIGDSLSYRLVLSPLWHSPDLHGLVDPTQAAAAIATWQALLGDMIETLPETPELANHVEQVRAFVGGLEEWRVDYIDALALNDVARADAKVADLEGQLALLAQSGEETLVQIFTNANSERSQLLADLVSIAA